MITIYSDGSSRGNPGPGGYGAILMYKNKIKEISRGFRYTTNNRMELLGVIDSLKALKRDGLPITIYTDSRYVVDSVMKGWVFKWEKESWKGDRKNVDLWKEYLELHNKHQIKFIWVKGHADNEFNNRCDVLAVAAATSTSLETDTNYELITSKNK